MNSNDHLIVNGSLTAPNRADPTLNQESEGAPSLPAIQRADNDVRAGFAHVSVLDISRADAAATTVGDVIIGLDPVGPNFPIRFAIEVVGEVIANHRYCVRAVVRSADGMLQWTTDSIYPVDLADASSQNLRSIEVGTLHLITVGRRTHTAPHQNGVGDAPTPTPTGTTADLILGAWECTMLDGRQVVAGHPPVFEFLPDGRVGGTTGCNRFNAHWTLDGSHLTVGPAATTMRACTPELNDQEAAVLVLLSDMTAAAVRIGGDELRVDTPESHHLVARRTTEFPS